jgi:hypothetical protein
MNVAKEFEQGQRRSKLVGLRVYRKFEKSLLSTRRSAFLSIKLFRRQIRIQPLKKLYSNLRQLGVINGTNKVELGVDVEKINPFFVTQSWN